MHGRLLLLGCRDCTPEALQSPFRFCLYALDPKSSAVSDGGTLAQLSIFADTNFRIYF